MNHELWADFNHTSKLWKVSFQLLRFKIYFKTTLQAFGVRFIDRKVCLYLYEQI